MLETSKYTKINDDFKYLIKMPMDSVSKENVERLMKEKATNEEIYSALKKKTIENIWSEELEEFKKHYMEYKKEREVIQTPLIQKKKTLKVKK